MQQEIREITDVVSVAFEKFRATDAPEEAKVQAGRSVRGLVGELSGLAWSLEHNPERWS
ncbi:hypothetical protein [Amycolatopsis sp. WQ 127309]|uniref:hypothetical protein n=1 Tax=Amycolatopsis sp. WQ 127309 TaxID=2932773 RepID=UPI001FF5DE50|nr:hypothetical protein [Amycolatopsis sp. WQ 127309]UOZ04629.1 hypothetical protein MUY22_38230 [Amycolatopsis sp. WQ 127309]